jgi:hypothetical protein
MLNFDGDKPTIKRGHSVFLGMLCAAVLLAMAINARAQQASADQEVPDNVAMHPAPEQPVPYSHKTHLALGLPCETCHTNAESDALMGFPENSTCMACHNTVATDQSAIIHLTELSATGQPIPWERVYRVLDGITWAHQPHVDAGVQCGACHGDVSQLTSMSMTTSVTSMASCISCHETRAADTACVTCHAWPSEIILSVDTQ